MCSSSHLLIKHCLLLLCTIILSTCGGEIENMNEKTTTIAAITTTTTIDDVDNHGKEETLTTIKPVSTEETKLPVDLLSDDVLLDPNVVLARLSRRDLNVQDNHLQPEYYDGYNDWYRSSGVLNRRQEYNFENSYDKKPQENIHKKMKLYPVFPGK